jgi:ribose transport system permease protein
MSSTTSERTGRSARSGESLVSRAWESLRGAPFLPVAIGSILFWILTVVLTHRGAGGVLQQGLAVAFILVVTGIGQMFVITTGDGAIDLSVASSVTLAGYVGTSVMNGQDGNILPALLVSLALGLGIGIVNGLLVVLFGIPALVGTLATGFVLQSFALQIASSSKARVSSGLSDLMSNDIGPLPVPALLGILLALAVGLVVKLGVFGRAVSAVGQSAEVARFAGVNVALVRITAFALCGAAAALAGFLLAGYSGGPSLGMGSPYQLTSIAVVVLGGTLISGGRLSVTGVWFAALMLTMVSTFVSVSDLSSGWELVAQGALIVIVLIVAMPGASRSARTH